MQVFTTNMFQYIILEPNEYVGLHAKILRSPTLFGIEKPGAAM